MFNSSEFTRIFRRPVGFNGSPVIRDTTCCWVIRFSGLSDPRNTATSRHTGYFYGFTIDSMRKSLGLFFSGSIFGISTVYKVYNKLFHVVNMFSQFRLCKCWYGQWDDPGSENDQIKNCLKPISKTWKLEQKTPVSARVPSHHPKKY